MLAPIILVRYEKGANEKSGIMRSRFSPLTRELLRTGTSPTSLSVHLATAGLLG